MTGPIYATALDLARPEIRGMRVRLLGVTASNLGEREQLSMFEAATRASDGRSRRPIRCGGGTAKGRSPGRGCSARGCRRRSSAIRAIRWIGAREACRWTRTTQVRVASRVVTAKVTRTSTRFRPTTVDIEHLFGLSSSSIEQTFCRTSAPDDTTQRPSPRKGAIPMAFIRVEPVTVQVRTDWFNGRPREITWGDERLPDHPSCGRPRGGRGLSRDQRPANPVRGRHAASAALPDVPAPLATLDGHRPRRRRPHRGLIANTDSTRGNWGLCASARRRWSSHHPSTTLGFGGGHAGTVPAPDPFRVAINWAAPWNGRCVRWTGPLLAHAP